MPLEPIDSVRGLIGGQLPEPVELGNIPKPSLFEMGGAAFRRENIIGSTLASESIWTPDGEDDPDFDPWDEIKGTDYEQYFDRFIDTRNRTKFEAITRDIDRETADRETLDRGGLEAMGLSMVAGLLDLPNMLPGAGLVRSGKVGYSLLSSAGRTAMIAGAGATVGEAALQATQQTRSMGESATTVGGTIALGSVMGAVGAKLMNHIEFKNLAGRIDEDMVVPDARTEADDLEEVYARTFASAGAAGVERPSLDALDIAPGVFGLAKGQAKLTAGLSPVLRLATSESAIARQRGAELFENPVYLKMNMDSRTLGPAVETQRKQYQAGLGEVFESLHATRKELTKAGMRMPEGDLAIRVGQAMRRGDTDINGNEAVTKLAQLARKRVIDPLTKEAIDMGLLPKDVKVETAPSYFSRVWNREKLVSQEPEFKRVAKDWLRREMVATPSAVSSESKYRLSKLEVDDAEIFRGRDFYEIMDGDMRVGSVHVELDPETKTITLSDISANKDTPNSLGAREMRGIARDLQAKYPQYETLRAMRMSGARRGGELRSDIPGEAITISLPRASTKVPTMAAVGPDARIAGDVDDYLDEAVDSVFNKLTGRNGEKAEPFRIVVSERGPLKERTFNIPDEMVENWLDSDIRNVLARYTRILGADVELARKFGDPTMERVFREIETDYKALRDEVSADTKLTADQKEKRLRDLTKAERNDKTDLTAGRDLLRGTYNTGGRMEGQMWQDIATAAKLFEYIRKMGGATVNSFADVGRHVMVHGIGRVVNKGLPALIGSVKGSKSGFAQAARQAKLAGQLYDGVTSGRLATMSEITDPYSAGSPFQRGMAHAGAWFSKLNLLALWTDQNKAFASALTQDRLVENVMSGFGKIDESERAYMAFLGIDQSMAERMASQLKGAEQVDGIWIPNTEQWADSVAKRTFYAALNKDVDSIIVTKGMGDVPLFMNTPVGSMVMQFKSFMLASNQRVLMRGLQEDQRNFLMGLTTMVTFGMTSYALYEIAKDPANWRENLSDNPGKWLAEGIDRSGIFSLMFEANNIMAKLGSPDIYSTLQARFPGEQRAPASRYASRGVAGSLLGPGFGTLVDTGQSVSAIAGSLRTGQDITQSDQNAMRRLIPFSNLFYLRWGLEQGMDAAFGDQ